MLGVALCHLIPHSFGLAGDIDLVMAWALVGLVFMLLLLRLFHFHQHDFVAAGASSGLSSAEAHSHIHSHDDSHAHLHADATVTPPTGGSVHLGSSRGYAFTQ